MLPKHCISDGIYGGMVDDEIQGCGLMMRCEWHGTKGYHFIMWAFVAMASVFGGSCRPKDFYVEYDTDKRAGRRMICLI